MSDLDRFELFMYVVEAPSLSQAAILLGMTKTSLSKQIKRLEESLKVDLFSRHKRRLSLTEQGHALFMQCRRLKRELDATRSICQQFHEEPAGVLRVVVFGYFAEQLIFPKLNDFLKKYPKLELIIETSERRMPDFEREQIDLAIGCIVSASLDVVQRRIISSRYALCASPHYFKEKGKPKNLEALKNHDYIGHSSRTEDKMIRLKSPYKVTLKPRLLLNSITSIIECAKQGLGLIQLPLYMLSDLIEKGELKEVLEQYQATNACIYYYYSKHQFVQPKVRKFIDFFLDRSEVI